MGDFSMSSVKIYDPTKAVANPNYNPGLPTGPSNFPYTRSQFPKQSNTVGQNQSASRKLLAAISAYAEHDDGGGGCGFQQLPRCA